MFRQAASAGYNSLEINEKWEQIQKISKWKAGKEKNEACIAFPWISKRGMMSFGKNLLTRTLRRSRVQRRNRLKS
jgi:hypothetical protein